MLFTLDKSTLKTSLDLTMKYGELAVGFREQPIANHCKQHCSNCDSRIVIQGGFIFKFSVGLLLGARQLSPSLPRSTMCGPNFYKGLKKHCSILGHLAPVFCVLFDHTGERIITVRADITPHLTI